MGYVDEGYEELYSDINRLGRGPQESYEALCSKSDSEVLDLFWDMYLRQENRKCSLLSSLSLLRNHFLEVDFLVQILIVG